MKIELSKFHLITKSECSLSLSKFFSFSLSLSLSLWFSNSLFRWEEILFILVDLPFSSELY